MGLFLDFLAFAIVVSIAFQIRRDQRKQEKGLYRFAPKRTVNDLLLSIWVTSAMLAVNGAIPRSAAFLLRGPHLFPFDIVLPSAMELRTYGAFEVAR